MLKINYKKIFFTLIACCFVFTSACTPKPEGYDSQGHVIRLNNYKGKWIIINYWATWCAPCVKEMAGLNNIYKNYSDKVIVLGVNFDRLSNIDLQKIQKKFTLNYPLLSTLTTNKFDSGNLSVLPITFIINPEGKLAKTLEGPQTEKQFLHAVEIN